ncbi:aldose 1-epimerase family protein [Acidaminobacter sp. JC074]|uniref:aldose 1-epimerase family protein n=1 Tax=Acidaminobacter sp. JC074 TaxID=2530199 RepID=UPI001F0E486A|nr:aldose 1-epimerase family protein [Acidaminobacter sp. JC074]
MIYKLSNEHIELAVNSLGAELCSLKPSGIDREYMWQKESPYWQRQSPVLFPSIGKSRGDVYRYLGSSYTMPKHGFVRDVDFACESSSDRLIFSYKYNDSTLSDYPFKFELVIKYILSDVLTVSFSVINHSDCDMPFSLGGHPAFNWDMSSEARLSFDVSSSQFYLVLSDGMGLGDQVTMSDLLLAPSVFANDALVYSGIGSVIYTNGDYRLELSCSSFKYLGIWSQVGAPFVCLEPWTTLPDMVDHDGEILNKKDIVVIGPHSKYDLSYSLKIS